MLARLCMPCTWLRSCTYLYVYHHMYMQARVKREAAANELKLAETTAKVIKVSIIVCSWK